MNRERQPRIGERVLFTRNFASPEQAPTMRHAAIICYIHSIGMVNLCVFDGNGNPFSATSVCMLQEGESAPGNGYCAEFDEPERDCGEQPAPLPKDMTTETAEVDAAKAAALNEQMAQEDESRPKTADELAEEALVERAAEAEASADRSQAGTVVEGAGMAAGVGGMGTV